MTTILSTFGVAVASALIPFINIELYLVALAKVVGPGSAVVLAIASGAGQTVGKVIWYEASRRSWESSWVQKKVSGPKMKASYEKWQGRIEGRPWYAGAIMFVSAFTGVPPLLVLAMVAGTMKMPMWVFVPTVLVGRILRFWLILAGVGVVLG